MNAQEITTDNIDRCNHFCGVKCISWSAIFLGGFIALGLSFLLNLFSTAIGLSIYRVDPQGVSILAIGGILGFAIGIIAVMFFSGWIAGYFGRDYCKRKCCGSVRGFAVWCVALILMILLAIPFSRFVTNYTNYLAHTAINSTISQTNTLPRPATTAQDEATMNDLGKGAFVLFLMFFLGAIASTSGGYVGVFSCEEKKKLQNKL